MQSASARHILVPTEEQCNELKQLILDGSDFADVAKELGAAALSAKRRTQVGSVCQ